MNKNKTDTYLIDSLINGDEKGILEIYTKLYPRIKNYVLGNKGNEDDAKDIMQRALLILSLKLRSADFYINSSFEGYFYIICVNLWRKEKKRPKVTILDNKDHLIRMEEIATQTIEQERWDLFQEKMNQLSENCKEILKSYFDKIPNLQIAKTMGYNSENVVRQRIFKCKKKLKELIQSDIRYNETRNK